MSLHQVTDKNGTLIQKGDKVRILVDSWSDIKAGFIGSVVTFEETHTAVNAKEFTWIDVGVGFPGEASPYYYDPEEVEVVGNDLTATNLCIKVEHKERFYDDPKMEGVF